MKTRLPLLTFFFILFGISILNAQDKEEINYLFNAEKQSLSGFAVWNGEFSLLNGDLAYSSGGGAAVLFNQSFYVGGYGRGLAFKSGYNEIVIKNSVSNQLTIYDQLRTDFNHGGLWLGYIHNYKSVIHFGGSLRIGGGSVSLYDNNYWEDDFNKIMQNNVFVLTPQIEVEFNLFKWMKANVGVGYRYATFADRTYLTEVNGLSKTVKYFENKDLSSPEVSISLCFGGFGNDILKFKKKK